MPAGKEHLEEVALFIREHRSNESNFEKLYEKLVAECAAAEKDGSATEDNSYLDNLREAEEVQAAEYRKSKEEAGSAWPEFERFVTQFEVTVTEALKAE